MLLKMCEEREVQQHNPVWSLLFRSFILCIAPFLKSGRKRDGDDIGGQIFGAFSASLMVNGTDMSNARTFTVTANMQGDFFQYLQQQVSAGINDAVNTLNNTLASLNLAAAAAQQRINQAQSEITSTQGQINQQLGSAQQKVTLAQIQVDSLQVQNLYGTELPKRDHYLRLQESSGEREDADHKVTV